MPKNMVAKRFELLHLTIPECSRSNLQSNKLILESGALDRSAKQPTICNKLKNYFCFVEQYYHMLM